LGARLLLVRAHELKKDWDATPTLFVAQPCNRPWKEHEINVFEYAKDKFWREYAGMLWDGDDPDLMPVYAAYGPSGGRTGSWSFTHAVRYWTDGRPPNHGFIVFASQKYIGPLVAFTRKCKDIRNRPALMVIYEPKQ
jgi:hypothetical protein